MTEDETPQRDDQETDRDDRAADESIETGEETPDFGERPESPDPGHPVGETEPHEGMPERGHEHPEDIQSPTGEEGEQENTTSPSDAPDPDSGDASPRP
jgi:hypothetical protein